MKGLPDQAWVTTALSDKDVPRALSLGYALRRAFTTRSVSVIASQKITTNLRQSLTREFDFVFYLDEDRNPSYLKLEDYAKMFAFAALQRFETCVYLTPTMLALQRCDDIFLQSTEAALTLKDPTDTSVFLFRPSVNHFDTLMAGLNATRLKGNGFGKYLNEWRKIQFTSGEYLDGKYNVVMETGKIITGFEQDISIVNLVDYPEQNDIWKLENSGLLGKLVATHWLNSQRDYVLPLMMSGNNSQISSNGNRILGNFTKEPIAIVGMSCRYPGSNNLNEFWKLLFNGDDGTCSPPAFRRLGKDASQNGRNEIKMNAGFLKVPVDEFDGKFFGISPKELQCMDPQQRILHELVWEALEDACIDPQHLRGTTGSVFMGSWTNDYKDILIDSGNKDFYRNYMGNSIGAAAARISYLLGLTGPSIATESGCSSAMVAVHLACRALYNGETSLALACGVNLLLNPLDNNLPVIFSPTGRCHTFSEDANGFARADGAGVLVLKRLSNAITDGDHIWGLIRGSAMSQEGTSQSLGTPTVQCEATAMKEALRDANVLPEEVSYIEAHGTGTVVGDPVEMAAIAKAYSSPMRQTPLIIGSVKTNVGHTESCSGITGIMKVILAMRHQTIPAHRNFTKLNPAIDLESVPAVIPLQRMDWKKIDCKPRVAGVSSFGITGTGSHVIIQEPPVTPISKPLTVNNQDFERPVHILKISAKTDHAMNLLLERYQIALSKCDDAIADICHSANSGRANFPVRAAIIGRSKDEICTAIQQQKFLKGEATNAKMNKVCFLFTGQGSQYPDMAKQLYATSPIFRMYFEYCDNILKQDYNLSISHVLWPRSPDPFEKINTTIYSQTAIFCVEYALLKLWESWGVKPDYVLGHSLGEFAAAVCAGILSVEDALKLVAERSRLIGGLACGKMLVIKANQQQVDQLMTIFANGNKEKTLDYAAINSDEQTVVSGNSDVILAFEKSCTDNQIKCTVLAASHAFHSSHMDPILEEYKSVAENVKRHHRSRCGYISGVTGDSMVEREIDSEYWVEHTRGKVNFLKASRRAVQLGCNIFVEIGPQPVLTALTMMNNGANLLCVPSLKKNQSEWTTLLTSLGRLYIQGMHINWSGLDQFQQRRKVPLPHYPFIGKKVWPDRKNKHTKNQLHPLLDSMIPSPSSTKLFQSNFTLERHEYIRDHAIGPHVIFPGAGYLEICLAAGLTAIQGSEKCLAEPSHPMKLENLCITAPLALQESKQVQIQTVVDFSSSKMYDSRVQIFQRTVESSTSPWILHATAAFSLGVSSDEDIASIDIKAFQESISKPGNVQFPLSVYETLASVGLKFGPVFKSIEKIWEEDDCGSKLRAKVKIPFADGQYSQYIIHPVILDAMIQSIMILKMVNTKSKPKLCVPIKIGKFVWLQNRKENGPMAEMYIQVKELSSTTRNGDNVSAFLLDALGNVLAVMSGVEFVNTTVKVIGSVLEQQTKSMPEIYHEIWRQEQESFQRPANLKLFPVTKQEMEKVHRENNLEQMLNYRPDIEPILRQLDKLVYFNLLRAMLALGWKVAVGDIFEEHVLLDELKIKSKFKQQLGYFMRVFAQEGILEQVRQQTWRIIRLPPSAQEIERELSRYAYKSDLVEKFRHTLLISQMGQQLEGILRGIESPLNILFPTETSKKSESSVEEFYAAYGKLTNHKAMITLQTQAWFRGYLKEASASGQQDFVFRILEVGAATGGYTAPFLEILEETGIEYEYTYTDISGAFFPAAEKRFTHFLNKMKFRQLNLEQDPSDQGFVPCSYDLVMASNVIHATKKLQESIQNLRILLKENGHFDLVEMTREIRPVTFLFGLLDGYWRFEDFDIRPEHCVISKDLWVKLLETNGFYVAGAFHYANDTHAFIKCRNVTLSNKICSVERKTWLVFHNRQNKISEFLAERIEKLTENRSVVSVSRGTQFQKLNPDSYSVRADSEKDFVKLLEIVGGGPGSLEGIVYAWSLENDCNSYEDILLPYFLLVKCLLRANQTSFNPRLYLLTSGTAPVEDGDMPNNLFSSLLWGFSKSMISENAQIFCKLIDVGCPTGSKDMMQIFYELWKPEKESQIAFRGKMKYIPRLISHKPILNDLDLPFGVDKFQLVLPESKSISDLKFGPITDRLVLATHEIEIEVKAYALNFRDVLNVIKPTDFFNKSNTIGLEFAGIVKRVSDQVSRWCVGDHVFGLNMQGAGLPSHIRMHEDDVCAIPKDMSFSEASTLSVVTATNIVSLLEVAKLAPSDTVLIHTATGGVGLNAIQICKHIGSNIIATAGSKRKQNYLRSLGIEHIFNSRNTLYEQEIMKITKGRGVDVILNSLTSEGFKEASLNVCAKGARFVEISKLSIWTTEEVTKRRPDVKYATMELGSMGPVVWRKVMKKVEKLTMERVVKPIPSRRFDGVNIREALNFIQKAKHIGKIVCVMPEIRQERNGKTKVYTQLFSENATYFITGGLGGIGFEVCKWMLKGGARYILLAGRNPPNKTMTNKIAEINSEFNANVQFVRIDVSCFAQCEHLIKHGIRGCSCPKSHLGKLRTLNLHRLTKDNTKLEHFVLFSSTASIFGSRGQSNHSAGNYFEDVIAHYRNSIGLPATSVNWGPWGQTGVATEVDIPGIKPITTVEAISGLEYALKSQQTQISVFGVESVEILSKIYPLVKWMVNDHLQTNPSSQPGTVIPTADDFWSQLEGVDTREEKEQIVRDKLQSILRNILKLDETEVLEDKTHLQDLGVDSLMYVEIRNELQFILGSRVTLKANIVRESSNVHNLTKTLTNLIEGGEVTPEEAVPTSDQISQFIRDDSVLPEHITPQSNQIKVKLADISHVLITGVTGTLGPYLLAELSQNRQISKITCLIRPKRKHSLEQRLENILKERDLLGKVDMTKVHCVNGNVALPQLGMEPQFWNELCNSVDAVIHSAAVVQHTDLYQPGQDSLNSMRSVNIGGLKNILEFCVTGDKLKHIFNSSTLLAATLDGDGNLSEEFPESQDFDGVPGFSYLLTKFIGDVIMGEAVEKRGIPGKCYRFPLISGHSKTGRFVLEQNHFMLRCIFAMQHKIIPNDPIHLPSLPVDICAKLSLSLFFNPEAPNQIYNICTKQPATEPEFVPIARRLGYPVEMVDFSVFAEKVTETGSEDSPLAPFKDLYANQTIVADLYSTLPMLQQAVSGNNNETFFGSKRLQKFIPQFYEAGHGQASSMEFIYNDFLFAKEHGWLKKFNL